MGRARVLPRIERLVGTLGVPPSWRVAAAVSAAYIPLYLLLDRISDIEALRGIDITPWNPQRGLSLALLLLGGPGYTPVAIAAALLSSQILPPVPVPLLPAVVTSLLLGGGYAAAATILRRAVKVDPRLQRSRDVVALIAVTTAAAGLVAVGFVATYAAAGLFPWGFFVDASLQLWTGDAIGAIVLTPLLLLMIEQPPRIHRPLAAHIGLGAIEVAAQWLCIAGALGLVFGFSQHGAELFYLLFLPLVWIAARRGLTGAAWAVLSIQIGLIAGLEMSGGSVVTVRTFQLLMFAVATTGLMLGAFVSERHGVARALADSRSHLAMILNTARDGVLMVDSRGRIESANPSVERLFGRPAAALVGRDIRDLIQSPPLQPDMVASAFDANAGQWELSARSADGGMFPIELTVGPFGSAGREHYTLVVRDITARRNAETRARAHESELARASRVSLAEEMASALAHELNQPLTAIAAYGRGCLRLVRDSDPESLKEGIQEVVQQAERAADVIARLRDFVRTGSLHCTVEDVRKLADGALALVRAEAAHNDIELRSRVPDDLPPVLIDRVHIEQVVLNLVRNAMDALPPPPATRVVSVEARRSGANKVEMSVGDSGPGVSDEIRGRLFQPFVTTKPGGMGLGLSISHSVVEAHGGRLRLSRNGETGAVFAFDLPIAAPPTIAAQTHRDGASGTAAG